MVKMRHPKSTIAAAVSAGLLGLALGGPSLAQTTLTNAAGSTTVNATNSGAGSVNASGSTTVNASTVSGSGTAASGTTAPVEDKSISANGTTTPTSTATTTNASGSTTVDATSSGSGTVNASGSTTVNASTVSGSGTAASGTTSPTTSTATPSGTSGTTTTATPTTTAAPSGTSTTVPTSTTTTSNTTGGSATTASAFSGSNTTSLRQGLRSGTAVTLTGSGESVTFTPPTGHMGNGEVERALTLASRDLAQAGITNPTPEQLQAALMGGTVTNAQGQTSTLDGVLVLRSQGMGWGKIAQTIGVHPAQSEQAVAHSRRGGNHGSGALASMSSRNERSGQVFGSTSDRNRVTQDSRATAISSSSATVNAPVADRDNGTRQAQDNRLSARSSDSARGLSAQAKDRISVGSAGGRSNASAAGAINTESVFNGPANAGPGAGKGHAHGKAKSGPGTADSGISGPGTSAGGSMSANAGGTSAGGDLGAGFGAGVGIGKGGDKGR